MNKHPALKTLLKPLRAPLRAIKSVAPAERRISRFTATILAELDAKGVKDILGRFKDSRAVEAKYLNLDWHVKEVAREALRLGMLDRSGLSVLDLGCGTGSFLHVLRAAGHSVMGLDLPDSEIYNAMIAFYGIERVTKRINKFEPLPDFGRRFDLITAYSVCFDMHHTSEVWGPAEWTFFLNDCRTRLNPRGKIFLNFNPATNSEFNFIPDSVATMLRKLPGGTLTANKEFFTLQCN